MTNKTNPFEGKAIKYDTIEQLNHLVEIAKGAGLEVKFLDLTLISGCFRKNRNISHYSNYLIEPEDTPIPYSDFIASLEASPTEFTPIRPAHYESGKISPLDFIEDKGLNFHLGNALKYIVRAGKKDPSKLVEDLDKAMFYLQRHIEKVDESYEIKDGVIDIDEFIFDKQLPWPLGNAILYMVLGDYDESISCIDKYKSLCQN